MALLPQLIAKTPNVVEATKEVVVPEKIIPAAAEKVYDKYWMTQISILAPSPTGEAMVVAQLVPARDIDIGDGKTVKELMPDADPITIIERNLFAKAATDLTVGSAMTYVLNAVIDMGKEQGLLK